MPIPDTTSIEFTELDILATQIEDVTLALGVATLAIAATTAADIASTLDPDTAATGACRDTLLQAIKDDDILAPITTAWNELKTAVNAVLATYDIGPLA